jgi:membrane-associated phospholipid phosphatase
MICSWKHKLILLGVYAVGYGVFYLYPNLHPLFEPRQLPLLAVDRWTPFLPWTFWVYTSEYMLILSVVVLLRAKAHFDSFARMAFGVLVGCGLFFLFYPTVYPRPVYPETGSQLFAAPMRFIQAVDPPGNCFPSMHVALTAISAWAIRQRSRGLAWVYGLWTVLICASTLTTKQHYAWDIGGGFAMMLIVITGEGLVPRKQSYGNPDSGS